MTRVETPQSRCRASIQRADITPPVGIYHRMWGAALHDRATGIHRPLEAVLLWIEPREADPHQARVIVSLDHCILDTPEMNNIRAAIAGSTSVPVANIHVSLTHTHGSGWMSRSRSALPGGELIGPYLDALATNLASLAQATRSQLQPVTILYGTGRCNVARHRDYFDAGRAEFVCGFNPEGPADDTLLVARVVNETGNTLAAIVNYACHPTTLAWENALISPDWVGAMREVVEACEGAPCLFLQGASGDLGPQHGFVGDTQAADRNGRQVGFAAAAALVALPPAGTEYVYEGAVVSGATLGVWKHRPLKEELLLQQTTWNWESLIIELPYRHDLPTIEQTTMEREIWLQKEVQARTDGDEDRLRTCRANIEQRTRQLARLSALMPGKSWPLRVTIGLLGDALWILLPGELYQVFQTTLRQRFAPRAVIISTLTDDWQPGYIPPASTYGYGIYQEVIAATAPGCLELLIESVSRGIQRLIDRISVP